MTCWTMRVRGTRPQFRELGLPRDSPRHRLRLWATESWRRGCVGKSRTAISRVRTMTTPRLLRRRMAARLRPGLSVVRCIRQSRCTIVSLFLRHHRCLWTTAIPIPPPALRTLRIPSTCLHHRFHLTSTIPDLYLPWMFPADHPWSLKAHWVLAVSMRRFRCQNHRSTLNRTRILTSTRTRFDVRRRRRGLESSLRMRIFCLISSSTDNEKYFM